MTLDLGALLATVDIETVTFDRKYIRLVRQFADLGPKAEQAATGTTRLDESLAGLADTSTAAATGTERVAKATTQSAAAQDKAAVAAQRHATAEREVGALMSRTAGLTQREQQAVLRLTAARERLNSIQESGVATTRQLATAQATLIGAQRSLSAAQVAAERTATGWRGALAGTLKTAGELGIVLGGIEIVRKGIEFVAAGKQLTDALNSVQAASHATDEQMKAVRAQAIGLGKDLKVPGATAVDAAHAIDDLVRSGMTLPRAMGSARAALLLAAAANVTTADSAKVLGDVLDEFKLSASQATKTAGILAGAATSAAGGLMGIFEAFTYVGTRARALGLGVQDVAAAVVDLSKAGITADRAGTGLAMMFQRLAAESPKGQKALDDLGVKAWNAKGRFVGLPTLIDELHSAQQRFGTGSQRFVRDISEAFGARAANAVTAFALRGREGYDAVYKRLSSGDVQKAAALMNRGAAAGFRQLGKEATAAGISVYQGLEHPVTTAVMWLGKNLPAAAHEAQNVLGPLGHFVGGVLADAWHLFGGAAQFVGDILGPVLHLIENFKTPIGGMTTLLLASYVGWRVFAAVPGLVGRATEAVAGMATSVQASVARYVASMRAIGVSSEGAAATATVSMGAIGDEAAAMSGVVVEEGAVASAGWAGLLGPLGAVAIGVGVLVSMFHHSASASHDAAEAAKAYTDALHGGSGSSALVDTITSQLADKKVPETLQSMAMWLGRNAVSGRDFVTAIERGGKPLEQLRSKLEAVIKAGHGGNMAKSNLGLATAADDAKELLKVLNDQSAGLSAAVQKDLVATKAFSGVSASVDRVGVSTNIASQTARQYVEMLGFLVDKNGVTNHSSREVAAALATVSGAFNTATATGNDFLTALATFSQSAGSSADRGALIGAVLKANAGDALNFIAALNGSVTAVHALSSDIGQAAKQVGKHGESTRAYIRSLVDLKTGAIDFSKVAAGPLISDLQQIQASALNAATATYEHNRATEGGKRAANDAVTGYVGVERSLERQLVKLGLTSGAAKDLTQKYLGVPSRVKTLIQQAGANPIVNVLNRIGQQLAYLTGHPWVITTNHVDTFNTGKGSGHGSGSRTARGNEAGGGVPEGLSWVGEGGPGARPELVEKHGPNVHVRSHPQSVQLAHMLGLRIPGFAEGTGPIHFQPRPIPSGGTPHGGTGGTGGVTTSTTGAVAVGEIHTGHVGGKKVWIYQGQRYASERAALNAQARDEKKAGSAVLTETASMPGTGVSAVAQMLQKERGPAARAMRLLAQAVTDAFDLKGVEKKIADLKNQIAAMKEYKAGIQSTLAGATDLTKAGSVADLEATLGGGAGQNNAFGNELKSLRSRAHGNRTLLGFINQLAASGQTTTLETLYGASSKDLANVTKDVGSYNRSLNFGGDQATQTRYGTSIGAVQAQEARAEHRQQTLVGRIDHLVAAIGHLTNRPVEVKIGNEVVARAVIHSHQFSGVLDELSHELHYGRKTHG